ncbi:MAG TPA: hypothetical protein VEQ65_06020, partial [Opitutus sp.]|nr:hypothetical protein [Opitutus sp.]
MKLLPTFLLATLLAAAADGQTVYDRHVIFDNSLPEGGYDSSNSYLVAPSTLETHEGKFPVDADRFVSPPNGLRLRWRSAPGGDWRMTVEISRRYARPFRFEGDSLTFWCFADREITAANSPRVFLQDADKHGSPAVTLVNGDARIPARAWTLVTLPFAALRTPRFHGTDDSKYRVAATVSVSFMQGLDDDQEHTLYLDDFQIRDAHTGDSTPPAAPGAVAVRAYERHVDVSWPPSSAEDLLAYRIYRSTDALTYVPVGTQQGTRTRFADFLGDPAQEASYRITAIDLAGNESSPSPESPRAITRPMNDEELLNMTQEACFRYYWEAAHPEAGLAPEVLPGNPNLLALGGSGFGVMALIVGAERGFAPRAQVA